MKKDKSLKKSGPFVFVLMLFAFFSFARANTLIVDNNPTCSGSIFPIIGCMGTYHACNGDATYSSTIKSAINVADSGDIISICDGTYEENNIKITKNNLTIQSYSGNRDKVIVKDSSNNPIFSISSYLSNLTLQDITIEQTKNSKIAIKIKSGGDGYSFQNLAITSEGDAIYQSNGTFQNATFENISINAKKNAIYMETPANITFYDLNATSTTSNALNFKAPQGSILIDTKNSNFNIINSNNSAIDFGNATQNYTVNNTKIVTSKKNATSIVAKKMDTFRANNLDLNSSNKGAGIWINGTVNKVDINGSNFHDMKNENIYFKNLSSSGSKITNNTIDSGTYGIRIKDSSNAITIQNNIIKNATGYGMQLLNSKNWLGSQIDHNCFIDNATNAYSRDNSANFDDGSEGNYWSDWSGSGKYKIENIPRYDNYPLSSCSTSNTSPTPIANYRMDECSWDGTTGEVKDSSDNNYNATAKNEVNTETNTTADGGICHVGKFDGSDDYINAPDIAPYLQTTASLSFWIKTTQTGNNTNWKAPGVIGIEESGGTNDIFWGWLDADGKIHITKGNGAGAKSTNAINDDVWHHVVLTRDASNGEVQVYVDGNINQTASSNSGDVTTDFSSIGRIENTDSSISPIYFKGTLDEVEIYDSVLSATQIEDIYNNEKDKKNYDGSERSCVSCGCSIDPSSITVTPLEFEGAEITLNATSSSPHWTHNDFNKTFNSIPIVLILPEKAGSHPASVRIKNITTTGFDAVFAEPQGEDGPHVKQKINFLAINKGTHKIGDTYFQVGTLSTQKIQQASEGTSTVNQWEKVDTIFASCQPAVVAQIQSLNNEAGLDIPNSNKIIRSKPWMTTAIDVNSSGINMALERSETNEGNISQNETIGYIIAPPNVQDSVVDDNDNNISFETIVKKDYFVGWDDSCKEVNFVNSYSKTPLVAANKNSKNESDGGWFRRCSLNSTKIGLQIDEDGSTYSTKYSYQSPPQDKERSHIAETGSIFAFSGTIVIHRATQTKNYKFDAWNISRDINDRNISTEIVSQDFNLTLASLNETNDDYQEFNGTVCTQISGFNSWTKSDFRDQNTTTVSFNVPSAIRDTNVTIVWKKDVDESCPLSNEDNRTNSTDNFAIRPKRFAMILPATTLHAGEDFNLTFQALNANDANSTDYNETRNTSFEVDANVTNANCNLGTFTLDDFTFGNGQKEDVNASYSEVADLNVTIKEINGSEFAKVDADDTPDTQRVIESSSITLSFKPYQFVITNYAFTRNNPDTNWRYMADVNESNISVSFNIEAQNEQNDTTQNFDAQCAAENVGVKIDFSVTNDDANASYFENINNTQTSGYDKNLNDINFSGVVNDSNFTDGTSSDITYALNVHRVYNQVKNPRTIEVIEVNSTSSNAKNIGLAPENNSSAFYYARLYTKDLSTSKTPDTVLVKVLVYDSAADNYVSDLNLTEELNNWYYYKPQNDAANGNIIGLNVSKTTSKKSANDDGITATSTFNSDGTFTIKVKNPNENTKTHYIHLDASPWIWYVYENFGSDYNESVGSGCSDHPCIKYNYNTVNDGSGVSSGNVKGVSFDVNVSKNSRGIRLLR